VIVVYAGSRVSTATIIARLRGWFAFCHQSCRRSRRSFAALTIIVIVIYASSRVSAAAIVAGLRCGLALGEAECRNCEAQEKS
jgi:hypothetical protein